MLTIIIQILETEESIHKLETKSVKCELSGKAFDTPDTLSYHKSVEHGQGKRPPIGVS
jgi:hypothetical protein